MSLAKGRTFHFSLPAADGEPHDIVLQAKAGQTIGFSLRTADAALARRRHGAALEQLQGHLNALESGGGNALEVSHRLRHALAGLIYKEFTEAFRNDPVLSPDQWKAVADRTRMATTAGNPLLIPTPTVVHAGLELKLGRWLDAYLNRERLHITQESRLRLLEAVAGMMAKAADRLASQAEGDYSPDSNLSRIPAYENPNSSTSVPASPSSAITNFQELVAFWQIETGPSRSSFVKWAGCVSRFVSFIGHDDPRRVSAEDVRRWVNSLHDQGLDVTGTYLAAIRAIYNVAVRAAERTGITQNPAIGAGLSKAQQKQVEDQKEDMVPYTAPQIRALLAAADKETNPVKRWVPWIEACTGCRVGEAVQLWGQRVKQVDGVWVMEFAAAEDGGNLKNSGSRRTIPVHPALIERGFLEFVKSRGNGPLFYEAGGQKARHARKDGNGSHKSRGVSNKLTAWLNGLGIRRPDQDPNHAFRHWNKSQGVRHNIQPTVMDEMHGHSRKSRKKRNAADGYRHADIDMMVAAMSLIQVPPPIDDKSEHDGDATN